MERNQKDMMSIIPDAELGHTAKEKLLKCATDLFNEKGYASTSVREIVEAAGVTKPALYHHYDCKEGIYLEILSRALERFEERLTAHEKREGTAAERLEALLDDLFRLCLEDTATVKFIVSIYHGPAQGAPAFDFRVFYLRLHDAIRKGVEAGIEKGEFLRRDPEDVTLALWGALKVVHDLHLARPQIEVGREGLARIVKLILSAVVAPARSEVKKKESEG